MIYIRTICPMSHLITTKVSLLSRRNQNCLNTFPIASNRQSMNKWITPLQSAPNLLLPYNVGTSYKDFSRPH